ncbi:MAG: AAA family ATPase [Candidatus Brocadiales bacterium]|nr:AAA family ATPase [Candidatus Brocadiales bacterium]
MTLTENKSYLWTEKYRPKSIEECILPERIKKTFQDMIESGESQNLLLSGSAGCGKTTVAKALCNELETDWMMINCSEDGNIDTLRTRIRSFASTVSLTGSKKVVILDEFDYANAQSMQPALRGFIEEFADNCRFILTCNFKNRIIEPIHSRCTCIHFQFTKKDMNAMSAQFMKRVTNILEGENVPFEPKVIAKLIVRYAPDFRRVINELQRYSIAGIIDVGILADIENCKINDLVVSMKEKDFQSMRKWVVDNLDNDQVQMFKKLYDSLSDSVESQSIPSAILIIAEYQYKAAFVADQEINMTACCTELMMECTFR